MTKATELGKIIHFLGHKSGLGQDILHLTLSMHGLDCFACLIVRLKGFQTTTLPQKGAA